MARQLKASKTLYKYWKATFNWREIEADINAKLPQFTTPINPEDPHGILAVHSVHQCFANPDAVPLIFPHSWPVSFLGACIQFPRVKEPPRRSMILKGGQDYGAFYEIKDLAFHVVAPS